MEKSDEETRRLAKLISHPIRAKIIELLGEKGPLGWKELSLELGVKTGALYHHLDTLEGLVTRDQSRKYVLTKSGQIVYTRTASSWTIDSVRQAALDLKQEDRGRRTLVEVFAPRSLLSWMTSGRRRAAAALLITCSAFALFSYIAGFSPNLYFLRPNGGAIPTVGGFAASLAAIVAVGYTSTTLVFKSKTDFLSLAAPSAFSFLPVVVFSAVTLLPAVSTFLATFGVVYTLGLVFFQSWSAAILGAGLSVASGVRIEKTILVSLTLVYATMVLMLVQGKGL